jgi:hypothetical protein
MKKIILTSLTVLVLSISAHAGEGADTRQLDSVAGVDKPAAIVVRVDEKSSDATIFLATDAAVTKVADDEGALALIESIEAGANKSELDQTTSTQGWYYWYYGNYWYRPYYYPTYYTYASYSYAWSYSYYCRGYWWYYYW